MESITIKLDANTLGAKGYCYVITQGQTKLALSTWNDLAAWLHEALPELSV